MEQYAAHEPAQARVSDHGPGVGRLVSDLIRHSASLVHNEAQLVKAEMSEKISQVGAGAGSLVGAAVLANAALIFLLGAATIGLAEVMEPWLAALIVGVITALIAFALMSKGRKDLKARNLAPRTSADSLRKDARVVKEHFR